MEKQVQIIYKRIGDLQPYEHNPRKNDDAVDAVAASIKEFGWKVPIVIDKDGVIVAGHTRYKAARKLGIKNVPCIIADDLSDDKIKAFRLADNKVSELACWNFSELEAEIDGIKIDMEQFGFNETLDGSAFDDLFAEATPKEKKPERIQCPHCGEWFET